MNKLVAYKFHFIFIYRGLIYEYVHFSRSVTVVYYREMPSKDVQGLFCFLWHSKIRISYEKMNY